MASKAVKKVAEDFVKRLKEDNLPVKTAFLYGSYAKKAARKTSDIDICIISPNFRDDLSAITYLLKISREVDSRIEAVGFSPKYFVDENPLVWEIKQTGIKIA